MEYKIYKLSFRAPCHFGTIQGAAGLEATLGYCLSDTLFSALANEAVALYGQEGIDRFIGAAKEGKLALSDLLPFRDDSDFYLPRPILKVNKRGNSEASKDALASAKELKKIKFIPSYLYSDYMEAAQEGQLVNFYDEYKDDLQLSEIIGLQTRVNLQGKESLPYTVGSVVFPKHCGLYCIVSAMDSSLFKWLFEVFKSLGYSGIGGKRSSGYGRFLVEECSVEELINLLEEEDGLAISLSTLIPCTNELDIVKTGAYSLVSRGGFVGSNTYHTNLQKRNHYFALSSGSSFNQPLVGQIIDVSNQGMHPVYRMGKGIFIRVKYDE